jgi:hypothetical protein
MASLTGFIDTFKLVVSVLPTLIEAIKAVEAMVGQSGHGSEKLELVRKMLEAAYSTSNDVGVSLDSMWPALQKVITAIVALYNKTGVFVKS